MKKLLKLLFVVLFVFILGSCEGIDSNSTSSQKQSYQSSSISSSSKPYQSSTSSSQGVESSSSIPSIPSSSSIPSIPSSSSIPSIPSSSSIPSIPSSSSIPSIPTSQESSSSQIDYPLSTLSFDNYDKPSNIDKYETGTYVEDSNTNLGFYRCYSKSYNDLATILATPDTIPDLQQSMIYNYEPILGIEEMELEYKSSSIAYILYSNDRSYSNSIELPASSTYRTITFDIPRAAYFRIEAEQSDIYLKKLTLGYNGITPCDKINNTYENNRTNISYSNFDNIEDLTVRSIPAKIKINSDSTYTVESTKSYTYYSYNYAINHPTMINEMALTNPLDVANYYTLFHDFPVNYGYKGDVRDLRKHFNNYPGIRQISHYSRTDGYARSVPFAKNSEHRVDYYELDFDVDGTYSTNQRGTGRLVVWEYGFKANDYNDLPVIVYTDDHYASFKEYLNYGQFGTRFNSEKNLTSYLWSTPQTLEEAK